MSRTVSVAQEADAAPIEQQVDALWADLHPIIAGERSAFAQRCHELALSMAHLHLLTLLDTHGAMSMGSVAKMLGAALPNVTGLVSRMQERGIVERVHEQEDRRVVLVRLTRTGKAQLRKLELIRRRRLALALGEMTPAQRVTLLQSIHDLRVAFGRANATNDQGDR